MDDLNGYYCVTAHEMARDRRTKLRKLARFSELRQAIIDQIMHGWSPQQIAGRLQLEGQKHCVSHETIYKFAYSSDGQAIKLWRHLPEHRARRRPRHARRHHGRRFGPEVNSLNRPEAVAERKQFGHWECDLIQFRQKFGKANVTSLVERVSRFTVLLRNNDPQSKPIMDKLIGVLQSLPISPAARLHSTAAPSLPTGRICRRGSERRPGFAVPNRPGRKAPWKIPIAGPATGS
jgi:IS30 family transposase